MPAWSLLFMLNNGKTVLAPLWKKNLQLCGKALAKNTDDSAVKTLLLNNLHFSVHEDIIQEAAITMTKVALFEATRGSISKYYDYQDNLG